MTTAGVLQTYHDVLRAGPGLYVAQSGTGAYFPLLALIEADIATLEGELFTARGHIITVRIGDASAPRRRTARENPPEQPTQAFTPYVHTIEIPREYFLKVFNEYTNWRLKWWREAIQNSVDAGATTIDLGSKQNPDGTYTVWCDDNGRGMDHDTLVHKFLKLGGTTKTAASGTTGGFGLAKELLLMPWISYTIHSREVMVRGSGMMPEVLPAPSRTGTRLEVVMPADRVTDGTFAMAYIERSDVPGVVFNVTVNNETKRMRAKLGGGDLLRTIVDKANIYFIKLKKGETQSRMYIRAKGLYMFELGVGEVPGYLIVELLAPSIQILTGNRDGFRDSAYGIEGAIQDFGQELAADRLSALKKERGIIHKKYVGTGKFIAKRRAASLLEQIGPATAGALPESDTNAVVTTLGEFAKQQEEEQGQTQTRAIQAMPSQEVVRAMLDQRFLGPDHLAAALKQLVWEPDFYIINDIDGFKVPKKFYPETMTPTVLKLSKVWAELCRYVFMQLGSDTPFGVGFQFSETTAASAVFGDEGEERQRGASPDEVWVLLNPYKDFYERKEIWRTSDADLKWLYAAAIHECTHVADGIRRHDESFSSALTRNIAKCADGYRKIRQIAASIKMRGKPELEREEEEEKPPQLPKTVAHLREPERWLLRRIAERDLDGLNTWISQLDQAPANILEGAGFIELMGPRGDQYAKLTTKGKYEAPQLTA